MTYIICRLVFYRSKMRKKTRKYDHELLQLDTSANAVTLKNSTIIRLNVFKLARPTEELVSTLVHECVHIADNQPNLSFGHGNNFFPSWKKNSAPYRIDQIAQRIASENKTS